MKLKNLIACFFLGFIMVSCIQDEAPNAEADIETCTVPGDVLNRDPIIGNDQITLPLKKGANISKLAPEFTLTPGATINPESGVVRDFSTPQKYVVTSEDGKWKKEYEVTALFSGIPENRAVTSYSFFHFPSSEVTTYFCGVEKSRTTPLSGLMVAPGVSVNSGASLLIFAPFFSGKVIWSFPIIGSRLSTSPGTVQVSMSASALGASSCMQETIIKPRKKQAIRFFNFIRFCF